MCVRCRTHRSFRYVVPNNKVWTSYKHIHLLFVLYRMSAAVEGAVFPYEKIWNWNGNVQVELAVEKGMKKNATHNVHLWNDDGKTTEHQRAILLGTKHKCLDLLLYWSGIRWQCWCCKREEKYNKLDFMRLQSFPERTIHISTTQSRGEVWIGFEDVYMYYCEKQRSSTQRFQPGFEIVLFY